MPHITKMDKRYVIFVSQKVIGYNRATEFNSRTTPLNLHRREVYMYEIYYNTKKAVSLAAQF